MWYNLIEASLLIHKNWDSVGMEPSVLVTHGHQRPGLASNCPGVVKEREEKQGLAFLISVLETGYGNRVPFRWHCSERLFYYFPCICQSKEEQDEQVSLLAQVTVRPETPDVRLDLFPSLPLVLGLEGGALTSARC